jgi:hypothetical protein
MANFKVVIASLPCTVQVVEILMGTDYGNCVHPDNEGTFNWSATLIIGNSTINWEGPNFNLDVHHNIRGEGILWIDFTPEKDLSGNTRLISKEGLEAKRKRVRGWESTGYKQTEQESYLGYVKRSQRTAIKSSVLNNNCYLRSCNIQTWICNMELCFCITLGSWCTAQYKAKNCRHTRTNRRRNLNTDCHRNVCERTRTWRWHCTPWGKSGNPWSTNWNVPYERRIPQSK